MSCKRPIDWVHFQLFKHRPVRQMNSLHHPWCKTRSQLTEVLLTLKKKKTFCQTDWRGKQQNIFIYLFFASCLSSAGLSTFLLSFPQPEGIQKCRGREERDGKRERCGCKGRCVFHMFTSNAHGTSRDCGIPSRLEQRRNDRHIHICHFWYTVHKDNTVG